MIRKFLELSTGHVTRETSEWLDAEAQDQVHGKAVTNIFSTDGGWFIWADEEWLTGRGAPKDLLNLAAFAKSYECDYLMLDCDGERIDTLPFSEW